ncbi:MAG: helix-turn-helix transcriptional regulator [archaeon]
MTNDGVLVFSAPDVGDPATVLTLFGIVVLSILLLTFLADRRPTIFRRRESERSSTTPVDATESDSSGDDWSRQTDKVRDTNRETVDERPDEPARSDSEKRERVLSLLEREGGQVRQSRIVDETGWSKTKVSRHLSSMADDGAIVKIQIGRENLICLPGHVPPAALEEDDD